MVRVLGRVWLAGLLVLGLIAGLLGVAPPGAVGTHGDEEDIDFAPEYSACVGAAAESAGFEDTEGIGAEGAIDCLFHYGITTGRSETTYAPGETVLRWQMALFLARAAMAAGIVLESPAADQGFTDIGAVSEEARNAINGLAKAGIMPGTSQSAFSPNSSVNRGSMAVLLDAFLAQATPGTGAFGGETEKYSEVEADNFNVFTDVNTVSLNTYNAIYRIYELGVTKGVGDHLFNPAGLVTRGQMASFITRAFAHTAARPAGVSIQGESDMVLGQSNVMLIVSVRDVNFQPVTDASVDLFSSTDPDNAFKDDGMCDSANVARVGGVGQTACEVDVGDSTTDASGDLTDFSVQVTDADVTVWAWTGDRDDKFDSDDTPSAQFTVGFSKAASQTLVTDSLEEGQTRSAFGEKVTVTIQIADEDGKAVADKGKRVTVEQVTTIGDSTTSSTNAMTTDADGKIVLEFTQTDPNASGAGDEARVALTLRDAPAGLPLQDEDGNEFSTKTYTWSDEAPVPAALMVSARTNFGEATDELSGAVNSVTATLTDQFGDPIRGKKIGFFSDTQCTPEEGETECSTLGIGAKMTGVSAGTSGGKRVLTGEARFMRTTSRDGRASLSYNYDSTDGVIESIWAVYTFAGTEGVRGFADTVVECGEAGALPAGSCRPADDPEDETTLTADRIHHYWAEDPTGVPFVGRILVKDVDNNQLVVGAGERVMLVKYDANDQLSDLEGPAVLSDFEKDLGDNADPAAAHLQVDTYQEEAGKVSDLVLHPEWARLDHPDGRKEGAAAHFGVALAADNGVMVVGASLDNLTTRDPDTGPGDVDIDSDATNDASDDYRVSGMVYVYPNGMETAADDIVELSPPDTSNAPPNWSAPNGYFGWDVDISGDTIVVGTRVGKEVYIYVRDNGTWGPDPTATLTRAADFRFGEGVAISGDGSTIAVAMTNAWGIFDPDDPVGSNSGRHNGRVIVYEKPGGGWADDADATDNPQLKDSSHPVLRQLVRAVALSNDGSVLVSGMCEWSWTVGCEGAVNVHVRPGAFGTWADAADAAATLVAKGGPKAAQSMGKYVAIDDDGDTIVASGSFHAGFADQPGVAYAFNKPAGGWSELDEQNDAAVELSVSRARIDDVFGQYIAISSDGSEIAAGRHYRQEGDFRGSVALFKKPSSGAWVDDSSPDEEYLGDAPNARLGWQPAFDRETGVLYTGIFDDTRPKDRTSGSVLWSIYRIDRIAP